MNIKENQVYHLKSNKSLSFPSFTTCNNKSSDHWIKYNLTNFIHGKVFNTKIGKEIEIKGRPCIRCKTLGQKKK